MEPKDRRLDSEEPTTALTSPEAGLKVPNLWGQGIPWQLTILASPEKQMVVAADGAGNLAQFPSTDPQEAAQNVISLVMSWLNGLEIPNGAA